MTSTTHTTDQQADRLPQTHPTGKDRTMSPDPSHLIRTILTATATFIGLLLLTALWTVYGPTYDAQAAPLAAAPTDAASTASEPCPAGEATGGSCGSEGALTDPNTSTSTDSPSQATPTPTPTPQRRCKGCRLSQEEYDARQADKQAAHDRAEARRQRGAERRAEAQHKREERAARKTSKSSTTPKSSRSHASNGSSTRSDPTDSSSGGPNAQDGTHTPAGTSEGGSDADSTSPEGDTGASDDSPAASAPYTPLEIPEASRRPAPYDASKDPFEIRREAARQAADAVNHSADQVKVPSTSPASSPSPASPSSTGYWAEQLPTWALGLIGFLAAAGLVVYKASRPRGDRRS